MRPLVITDFPMEARAVAARMPEMWCLAYRDADKTTYATYQGPLIVVTAQQSRHMLEIALDRASRGLSSAYFGIPTSYMMDSMHLAGIPVLDMRQIGLDWTHVETFFRHAIWRGALKNPNNSPQQPKSLQTIPLTSKESHIVKRLVLRDIQDVEQLAKSLEMNEATLRVHLRNIRKKWGMRSARFQSLVQRAQSYRE